MRVMKTSAGKKLNQRISHVHVQPSQIDAAMKTPAVDITNRFHTSKSSSQILVAVVKVLPVAEDEPDVKSEEEKTAFKHFKWCVQLQLTFCHLLFRRNLPTKSSHLSISFSSPQERVGDRNSCAYILKPDFHKQMTDFSVICCWLFRFYLFPSTSMSNKALCSSIIWE